MSAQTDRIVRELEDAVSSVQQELAEEIQREVEDAMPVDTGFAKAHVSVTVDDRFNVAVADEADYVEDLDHGSSPQAEPEFIGHAVERAFATVEARMATRKVEL